MGALLPRALELLRFHKPGHRDVQVGHAMGLTDYLRLPRNARPINEDTCIPAGA